MTLLDRYVTRSVLSTTLYAVFVLSVVLILGNIFKEALDLLINRDVPIGYLLFFMACVLPFSFTFTVPWAFLTAVLLTFGRMSADNETIALRASGISLIRTCLPVLALGALLSVFCFWIGMQVAPAAELAMRQSLAAMARSNPSALFVAGEVIDQFHNRKFYIGSNDHGELRDITIVEEDDDGRVRATARARAGRIETSPDGSALVMTLRDALSEQRQEGHENEFGAITHSISVKEFAVTVPLDQLVKNGLLDRPLRTYDLGELIRLMRRPADDKSQPPRVAVVTELSRRPSLALASLAFAFLALPLGIVAQRKETSAGFAISLSLAFGYYFFVEMSNMLRWRPEAYPYLILWIPNVLFVLLGTWLLWRLDRR